MLIGLVEINKFDILMLIGIIALINVYDEKGEDDQAGDNDVEECF